MPQNLCRGTAEWAQIAVLSGFSADVDEMALPGGIGLRRLSGVDVRFLYAFFEQDWMVNQWWNLALSDAEFCLSINSVMPASATPDAAKGRHQFESVLTCLRLLQPGAVKIVALACWPTNQPTPEDWPDDEPTGQLLLPYGAPLEGPGYHLGERSAEDLVDLMPKLPHGLGNATIRAALSFFNESYEYFRMRSALMGFAGIDWPREVAAKHDKLIRLWMCLEALLMNRQESDEIGKRVSYRAEMLLDRQAAVTLGKSWKVRCAVVHGEAPKDVDTVLGMTEMETRRLLQCSIRDPEKLRLFRRS